MKPGIKTTEFWVTVAALLGALLMTVAGQIDGQLGATLLTIGSSVYTLARSLAKTSPAATPLPLAEMRTDPRA